jgi:hypothetical protein
VDAVESRCSGNRVLAVSGGVKMSNSLEASSLYEQSRCHA